MKCTRKWQLQGAPPVRRASCIGSPGSMILIPHGALRLLGHTLLYITLEGGSSRLGSPKSLGSAISHTSA
jgi:hypothetical protein